MCDNLGNNGRGSIKFFLDGQQSCREKEGLICQTIGYIGNSKDGS